MSYTLEQQKENRKKWVEALRGRKYKQTTDVLFDGVGYCCLGVLAHCAGVKKKDLAGVETLERFPGVLEWAGLRSPAAWYHSLGRNTESLASKNDTGVSFAEIADIIESEPAGLFVEPV